jgi:hypothetical protein
VNAGTVTFQVKDAGGNVGAAQTDTTVVAGAASVDYTLPAGTAAGDYTVVATYNPSDNFTGSSDTAKLTVGKRTTTTVAAAVSNVTYSATATDLTLSATVSAAGSSVNAGTVTFQVQKADGTVIVSGTSATVANGAASKVLTLPAGTAVGRYTVQATYGGTGNLLGSDDSSRSFSVVYGWNGFLQPINDTAHQTGLYESKFKLGQTIPVKFDLTNAQGQVVQQTGSPTFTRSGYLGACDSSTSLEAVPVVSPDGAAVYAYTGGHYQYNWSTKGITSAGEYRIFANLADGTSQSVYICLTK